MTNDSILKLAGAFHSAKARRTVHTTTTQHRLARIGIDRVEYLAKDTRNKRRVPVQYTNEEFVDTLAQYVPDPYGHAMRYFGLFSPRCKAQVWAAVFVLLNQQQQPHPPQLPWRWLRIKTFGTDPLLDSQGQLMRWVGRRKPFLPALN
jgi:hypothetical protein